MSILRRRGMHGATDPMILELRGEAFTFPVEITRDPEGEALRRAALMVRTLEATKVLEIIGEPSDWAASIEEEREKLSKRSPQSESSS
jgi:hypothetical protein